jgi:hypothetical protein
VVWDLDTGRVVGSWPLPKGLNDALAFHPSGKQLLGRRESRKGEDPRVPPLVFRVRELLGPGPIGRPLAEVEAVDKGGHDMMAPRDGRYFVIDGARGPEGRRAVKVFDPLTDKTLFETTTSFRFNYSCIQLDPTGRAL